MKIQQLQSIPNSIFFLLLLSTFYCYIFPGDKYQTVASYGIIRNKFLRDNYPNTEFVLVRIFHYLDWIRRFTRKNSIFGHFSRKELVSACICIFLKSIMFYNCHSPFISSSAEISNVKNSYLDIKKTFNYRN